jgi:hypothetical protein
MTIIFISSLSPIFPQFRKSAESSFGEHSTFIARLRSAFCKDWVYRLLERYWHSGTVLSREVGGGGGAKRNNYWCLYTIKVTYYKADFLWHMPAEEFATKKLYSCLNISIFRNLCIRFLLPHVWGIVKYRWRQCENTDLVRILTVFCFRFGRNHGQCTLRKEKSHWTGILIVSKEKKSQQLNTHNQLTHSGTEQKFKNTCYS